MRYDELPPAGPTAGPWAVLQSLGHPAETFGVSTRHATEADADRAAGSLRAAYRTAGRAVVRVAVARLGD